MWKLLHYFVHIYHVFLYFLHSTSLSGVVFKTETQWLAACFMVHGLRMLLLGNVLQQGAQTLERLKRSQEKVHGKSLIRVGK